MISSQDTSQKLMTVWRLMGSGNPLRNWSCLMKCCLFSKQMLKMTEGKNQGCHHQAWLIHRDKKKKATHKSVPCATLTFLFICNSEKRYASFTIFSFIHLSPTFPLGIC